MKDENEKTNEEDGSSAIKTGGTFAEQVANLSTDQLKTVHSTVKAEVDKRSPPDIGAMSDQEFERFKHKVGM
jgi:hypothetical protein